MSISIDPKKGVRLKTVRRHSFGVAAVIIALEAVFSLLLYMSLAERVFVVNPVSATAGVPELVSYQGMLTDTSGNPLGGAGSVYCFRYSIWDAATSGNQLWPSGTPGNSTTTVIDGVFSDEIGRVDSLSPLDFESTSTYYLQVQVSTSSLTCATGLETLSPRQQITSDAWSQTAQGVYGSQLRTFSSNNTVQIGTGGGVASGSQTLLSLDVVNTGESIGGSCTTNGTLWYDSNLKRALVCEQNLIVPISESETLIGNGITGTSTIVNPVWAADSNITFSTNGNTISIEGAGGAGGTLPTFLTYNNRQLGASSAFAIVNNSVWVTPFRVNGGNVSASTLLMMESFATNASLTSSNTSTWGQTLRWGMYSNPDSNSTEMDLYATGSVLLQISHSSNTSYIVNYNGATTGSANSGLINSYVSGVRMVTFPYGSSITPGLYAFGYVVSTAGSAIMGSAAPVFDNPLNATVGYLPGVATASAGYGDAGTIGTSTSMPATFALTNVGQVSNRVPYVKMGDL
ncbi:MAG TPA: hypothetical protein VMA75_01670 [Candidatus Paceibacterota bacterium]|nr:hypothetical protein [Candidatus Paceibacterota bacterium]